MNEKETSPAAVSGEAPRIDLPSAKDVHKGKVVEAASFVVLGYGASQVIRLVGNIILTRLLVPEMFGLITLARVFVTGLNLFSDVGLEPAIIRSRRSDDPVFLNTAWTIQVMRSAAIAALSIVIAFPVAALYKEATLAAVIPVIGLFGMTIGFQSTSLTLLNRELQQKKLTVIELVSQVVGLGCIILAAYFMRNIWALLVGDFVGGAIRTVWSHLLNRSRPNRFSLDKRSVQELLTFGKWILVSTAMTFLAAQTDRLLLGKLCTMAWFGVYSIAVNLSELPKQVIQQLSSKVIFPLISKYAHFPRGELRDKMRIPRGKMLLALAGALALFGCFGDLAIFILYDPRYHFGARILPWLAFGLWPFLLTTTIDGSLYAVGKPKYCAFGNFAKFLFMAVFIPLSFRFAGEFGPIVVIALSYIPYYVIVNIGLAREGLSLLKQDALASLALAAATGVLLLARFLLGMGMPGHL